MDEANEIDTFTERSSRVEFYEQMILRRTATARATQIWVFPLCGNAQSHHANDVAA